jgi:hypothetical protein
MHELEVVSNRAAIVINAAVGNNPVVTPIDARTSPEFVGVGRSDKPCRCKMVPGNETRKVELVSKEKIATGTMQAAGKLGDHPRMTKHE